MKISIDEWKLEKIIRIKFEACGQHLRKREVGKVQAVQWRETMLKYIFFKEKKKRNSYK